jgi:hypothetical protein
MALIKLSNNGVKNITSVGSIGTGELKFISKQTASSSASISFTSGIDSTYKEYIFYFVNIHPNPTGNAHLLFNFSTDSGSNYNVTKTTTVFHARHDEGNSDTGLTYETAGDLAQSTDFQRLTSEVTFPSATGSDEHYSGYFHLFNPSSTTFVKHFISTGLHYASTYAVNDFVAGYGNTTSAINGVQFKMTSGNIDSGDILLYGVN